MRQYQEYIARARQQLGERAYYAMLAGLVQNLGAILALEVKLFWVDS